VISSWLSMHVLLSRWSKLLKERAKSGGDAWGARDFLALTAAYGRCG